MKDLTPAHLRCMGGACPSVQRLDDGRLLIVGAAGVGDALDLNLLMSEDETAIIIHFDILRVALFEEIDKGVRERLSRVSPTKTAAARLAGDIGPDEWVHE
jgi:hypothetical protein